MREIRKLNHLWNFPTLYATIVPKRVLRDSFDTPPEPDEPQNDVVQDHDELYDDDQFYKEPEAIPPEPKLQGDLAKDRTKDLPADIVSVHSVPSSVRPPLRNRDDSTLEGEFLSCVQSIWGFLLE